MDELFNVLREQFGKTLTQKQHNHICGVIERFVQRAYVKYAAGAAEHKTFLPEQPVIKEILWESIDLLVYADTLCQQALNKGVIYSETEKQGQSNTRMENENPRN